MESESDQAFSPTTFVLDLPSCSVASMASLGALIGCVGADLE
jgi:hypothetical protein